MAAVLAMGATAAFAQKFGQIDYQTTLFLMPEIATVQTELQKVETDYLEVIEGMQVERNKLMDEISKLPETTSETARQLKNRQAIEIEQRIQEYYQSAQEGIQTAQNDLLTPLRGKIDAAIEKISKAQSLTGVFQTGAMVYLDAQQVVDITAPVRAELGIAADATLPAGAAATAGAAQ
jgi:outer membrane protein